MILLTNVPEIPWLICILVIISSCILNHNLGLKEVLIFEELIKSEYMEEIHSWHNGDFHLTTDQSKFDLDDIFQYLTKSTWAKGIDKRTVVGSIEASFCFGLFYKDIQIGFARFITDHFTFGYL